ncbi:agmatinase [Sulfobacillus harzensis]|uniref:Agmatinase n=1 Tax=Sulfobacillus harzensis TaxID=2729629 RepID=A0A7Y0L747_9FIRM|nr:agmatinase [Sulfobacillus harzensis]NMP24537.1 agmatinase [Sulfobacillus harzensis]
MSKNHQRDVRQRNAMTSPRFAQIATFARLPYERELSDIDLAFVGVPFDDGTTFRSGARMGPSAVREHSRLLRPFNPFMNVAPFDILNVVDWGDVDIIPGFVLETFEKVQNDVALLMQRRTAPLVCGGDHSITLPVLRELAKQHGPVNLIHFDSHLDFWDEYWEGKKYTHGTWLRRVVEEGLVDVVSQAGIRGSQYGVNDMDFAHDHNIDITFIDDFHRDGVDQTMKRILDRFSPERPLYISWDIDVVDPAFAGATGTPEVGGLTSWQAVQVIRRLVGWRVVGMDIVEVSPPYDGPGGQTSLLAANLFYEIISVMARNTAAGLSIF